MRDLHEARDLLALFELTHEIEVTAGGPIWARRSLPEAGGVNDQDHWTMQALEHVKDEMNRSLLTRPKRKDTGDELARFRQEQRG